MAILRVFEGGLALVVALVLLSGLAAGQPVWFDDEDSKNYPFLPDEGQAFLYAYVGAFCNSGQPRSTYSGFQHDDGQSDATPNPPYATSFTSGRHGAEAWRGGFSQTDLTFNGIPIYQPAYASIADLPNIEICPT